MSRVDAAAADRLPWLDDEVKPERPKRSRRGLIGWGAATVVAVAGLGLAIGVRTVEDVPPPAAAPSATVPLPQVLQAPAVKLPPQPTVSPAPVPEVHIVPAPQVHIAPPPRVKCQAASSAAEAAPAAPATEKAVVETPAAPPAPLRAWEPRVTTGAAGRLVQIGAFGSVTQAKRGWWYMVRAYPAMRQLPAVVRPARNSKGRQFYRFRVGTTSQAHSEVLCQRMQRIGFSCAVVGLPWKPRGVER